MSTDGIFRSQRVVTDAGVGPAAVYVKDGRIARVAAWGDVPEGAALTDLGDVALMPGVVVRCRPIGMLKMSDEGGGDTKLLAVPIDKLTPLYRNIETPRDLPEVMIAQLTHFFGHYKDLEPGKWVRIEGWVGPEEAKAEILESVKRYKAPKKGK